MDINEINHDLQKFWDDYFNHAEPINFISELKVENKLDEVLKYLGDNANKILDIGTGLGYCLFMTKLLGKKMNYGLGIDTSTNAINSALKTCEIANIEGIDFVVADNSFLESLADNSYDGIISSNVLDVIPEEITNDIINQIKRILASNGLFILKLNFFLTEELIEKLKMEKIGENSYTLNGILRAVNYSSEEWIKKFDGFSVVLIDEYERIKNGPKDRIIVFRKL